MSDAYANRTDLNNAANRVPRQVATGQTYGKATQQMEAQRAVPMGSSPTDVRSQRNFSVPGESGPLTRPTERPTEPITAGAPFGDGAGPEVMPIQVTPAPGSKYDLAERVRIIASIYPNPSLLGLLAELESF
jgi:hypothetical protein